MRQVYKRLWLAAVTLLLIGGLTIGVSLAMGGVSAFDKIQNARYEKQTVTLAQFSQLKLDLTALDVDIQTTEEAQATVTYYRDTKKKLDFITVKENAGQITLKENYTDIFPVISLGNLLTESIKMRETYGQLQIKIPSSWQLSQIDLIGGSSLYTDGLKLENAKFTVDPNVTAERSEVNNYYFGDITMVNTQLKHVTFDIDSGKPLILDGGAIENSQISSINLTLKNLNIKDSQIDAANHIWTLGKLSWLGNIKLSGTYGISLLDAADFATTNLHLTMPQASDSTDTYHDDYIEAFPLPKDFSGEIKTEGGKQIFTHTVEKPTTTITAESEGGLITLDFGAENQNHYDPDTQYNYYNQYHGGYEYE